MPLPPVLGCVPFPAGAARAARVVTRDGASLLPASGATIVVAWLLRGRRKQQQKMKRSQKMKSRKKRCSTLSFSLRRHCSVAIRVREREQEKAPLFSLRSVFPLCLSITLTALEMETEPYENAEASQERYSKKLEQASFEAEALVFSKKKSKSFVFFFILMLVVSCPLLHHPSQKHPDSLWARSVP